MLDLARPTSDKLIFFKGGAVAGRTSPVTCSDSFFCGLSSSMEKKKLQDIPWDGSQDGPQTEQRLIRETRRSSAAAQRRGGGGGRTGRALSHAAHLLIRTPIYPPQRMFADCTRASVDRDCSHACSTIQKLIWAWGFFRTYIEKGLVGACSWCTVYGNCTYCLYVLSHLFFRLLWPIAWSSKPKIQLNQPKIWVIWTKYLVAPTELCRPTCSYFGRSVRFARLCWYKGDRNARKPTQCILNGRWLERTETIT